MLVSGMIVGTMFTLFVVPSIYMLIAKTRVKVVDDHRARREAPAGELAGAAAS